MIAKIQHSLHYQYSEPVTLDPHILYLHPRKSSLLTVQSFELRIDPQPVQISKNLDPEEARKLVEAALTRSSGKAEE